MVDVIGILTLHVPTPELHEMVRGEMIGRCDLFGDALQDFLRYENFLLKSYTSYTNADVMGMLPLHDPCTRPTLSPISMRHCLSLRRHRCENRVGGIFASSLIDIRQVVKFLKGGKEREK
jgi:hypothetical protein